MTYSKQLLTVSLLLMLLSTKAFSCVGPQTILQRYDEREITNVVDAYGSIDDFLDTRFGASKWKYDEQNLSLKIPENPEHASAIPVEASISDASLRKSINKVTVYYQSIVDIHKSSDIQEIFKAATFNLYSSEISKVSTRLNLNNTQKVFFFAVFEPSNANDVVRVIKLPKARRTGGRCTYIKYAKGDNASFKHTHLERYESHWSKEALAGTNIPSGQFKGFYFDRFKPMKPVKTELVSNIRVNVLRSMQGIEAEDLAAYWVGNFHYDNDREMEINIRQGGHHRTRIIINDKVIFNDNYSRRIIHSFKKGVHKIEVEHLSNYFANDLSINIRPVNKLYSYNDLIMKLPSDNYAEYWLVSAYEAKKSSGQIDVVLEKSSKPVVLLLQSYEVVDWEIHNPHGNKIEAVVIGKAIGPGSSAMGDIQHNEIYFINFLICNNYNHKTNPGQCRIGRINNFIGGYKL